MSKTGSFTGCQCLGKVFRFRLHPTPRVLERLSTGHVHDLGRSPSRASCRSRRRREQWASVNLCRRRQSGVGCGFLGLQVTMSRKPSALTNALHSSTKRSNSSSSSEPSSHSRAANGVSLPSRVPRSAFPCLYVDSANSAGEQVDEFSTDLDADALNFSRLSFSSADPGSYRRHFSMVVLPCYCV